MKRWYHSRLVWLGIVQLLLAIIEILTESTLFTPQIISYMLMIAGVLTVVLRWLTTDPLVGKAEYEKYPTNHLPRV